MPTPSEIYSAVTTCYTTSSPPAQNPVPTNPTSPQPSVTPRRLPSIPADSNLGLSCGNPHVLAKLREGEVVVDLGCGAGFDVFLAAPKVGATGMVIGVDMNAGMLGKAEQNRKSLKDGGGGGNVRFVEAPITDMRVLEGGNVDCVMSNCVVNLVPEGEKHLVFGEMYRLLKPGGRVTISDILIRDGRECRRIEEGYGWSYMWGVLRMRVW